MPVSRPSPTNSNVWFAVLVAVIVALPCAALAQDSDADGVNDGLDTFPCDVRVSAEAFAPARGVHGMILAEDQWPAPSDDDFNDFVGTYNYAFQLDDVGNVVAMRATFNVLALGGRYDLGLGLHLPVAANLVAGITRTVGTGPTTNLVSSVADGQLTFTISSNLREVFGGPAGQINSIAGSPALQGETIVVTVDFATAAAMPLGEAPFDLYVVHTDNPAHEIHRTPYAGTANMDQALFGTQRDGSSPGRYYVDNTGLPAMLVVPEQTPYPLEATSITSVFPNIANFAASGGTTDADYYASQVVTASSYAEPGRPSAAFITADRFMADVSCLPTASCKDILAAGQSTGNGLYWLDPDGAQGNLPAFQATCDMSASGGGWTRLDVPTIRDHLSHTFTDYQNNCSVAEFVGDLIHFGEVGSCNSTTHVSLSVNLPFGYSAFRLEAFGYVDGPSSGSWDVGTANLTNSAWAQSVSDSVGDIAFGSQDLATPTASYTNAGQPRTTNCTGCTLLFPGNGVVYNLGQTVTDFTIRAYEGGGQVEDVYIGSVGHIWVR